ncbi:MAG TPA: hypothetical protein VGF13_17635 [Verrucomicrobiae bacterium]
MAQTTAPDLPGIVVKPVESPPSLKPAAGREQPALWVKTLAVYSDWPPTKETLLRRMDLRRGLNILWARPSDETSAETKLTGHGAGKTTFCRMLRYILDDATFGTKDFREAFNDTERHGFRNGWALGEVIVGGEQWLVGRPLGHVGYQSFAKKGGSLDDAFPEHPTTQGYDEYQKAIESTVLGAMKLRQLSGSGGRLEWEELLGWLARDQEAHYSGLLEWRHPDSDHGTTPLSEADKENLIRLVLGLINPDEQKILREHAKKAGEHEDWMRNDKPKIDFWVKRSRLKLEAMLEREVADPKDPLLQQEIDTLVRAEEKKADAGSASAEFDKELDRLGGVVASRESEWRLDRVMLLGLISKLPKEQRELQSARQEATDAEQQMAVRVMHPFQGYCSQPLNRAWKEKCPLADDRPTDDQVDKVLNASAVAAKTLEEQRADLEKQIATQEKLVGTKLSALNTARRELDEQRKKRDAKLNELNAPRQHAADLKAAFEDYKKASSEWTVLSENLETWDKEKRKLDTRLEAFAEQHDTLVNTFSKIFHHIVQTAMGSNLIGTVEFSGKGIEPRVRDHALRDSPAIKVAKFLAFDIAAMILTMTTGEGHHPRFLLHDSPREADLDAAIYRGLFLAVLELENGDDSAFQYIVTTTSSPPEKVNRGPWRLNPVLNASAAETRFLGVDL